MRFSMRSSVRWRAATGSSCAVSVLSRSSLVRLAPGRNPRTGANVPVDQKSVPFFKTGKEIRERLNSATAGPRPAVRQR